MFEETEDNSKGGFGYFCLRTGRMHPLLNNSFNWLWLVAVTCTRPNKTCISTVWGTSIRGY
jgi:hypothetical protein